MRRAADQARYTRKNQPDRPGSHKDGKGNNDECAPIPPFRTNYGCHAFEASTLRARDGVLGAPDVKNGPIRGSPVTVVRSPKTRGLDPWPYANFPIVRRVRQWTTIKARS